MKKLEPYITERGFSGYRFEDLDERACSIQRSSLWAGPAIRFGRDSGEHAKGLDGQEVCLARMHLSQEEVKALLPILQHFVETGEILPADDPYAKTGSRICGHCADWQATPADDSRSGVCKRSGQEVERRRASCSLFNVSYRDEP